MAVPAERHGDAEDLRVSDLTISQLRLLVSELVSEAMDEMREDAEAASSSAFIESVREARSEYATGKVKTFGQIFDDA